MTDASETAASAAALPSLARSMVGMGAAAAFSRLFGGLRMVVIAAVLGTTYLGNAFQSSNSFSNVLFELLAAGALSAVLVPTFVDLLSRGEDRRMEEIAGGVLSLALAGLGLVSLIGVALAPQIARVLTSGVADPDIASDQRALAAYLLRFFIPQVLFYAIGAVAMALLHARSKFALTAIAPIGNTVVLVASMAVFHAMVGSQPGLDLSQAERFTLAAGGTLGVVAFVGIPAVGLHLDGFRWRLGLRRALRDDDVRRVLRLSGWAVLQTSGTGILLVAALVVSGGVEGGVVAYQLAMVVFLAPYGILAQPIHTAVLTRLASDHAAGDTAGMHQALRWAVDALVVVSLPVAALLAALAEPTMRVLAFGEASRGSGPALLSASLVGLAIGVPVYGGFLLLTRAAYAIGDSRTPALAALWSSLLGAAGMVLAGSVADGRGLLAGIGLAHSGAYLAGMLWLGHRLRPVAGGLVAFGQLRPLLLAGAVGGGAWVAMRTWSPDGRLTTVVGLVIIVGGSVGVYAAALRALGALPGRGPGPFRPAGTVA